MLSDRPLPSGALVLAVLAAIAAPAHGEDMAVDSEAAVLQHPAADALDLGQGLSLGPAPSQSAVMLRAGGLALRVSIVGAVPASQEGPLADGSGRLVELSRSFGNAAVSVSMSQTSEPLANLGTSPALTHGLRVSTSTLQFAGAVMISPRLAIAGQAAYGLMPDTRSADTLANGISRAGTSAFSFGLVASDRMRRGDRLSVSLSQPMRSYSGRFMTDLLSRGSGTARERLVFSMVPLGREMRAQLNYQMPAGYGATFGVALMVRRNPNELADASAEALVVARYAKSF
ncbi:hypothetical protein [Noviherbaspirillum denitrificans]|uniref:Uncharacterized protein n=1 Tax=Noviherbaspirillum denitrificans TaxID=1968433 RepID=A0A254TFF1_9BURK|nr:hypothetical protein [Noviherbaspirillum denitrificans]OWW21366.1 hypothetical protein AYR66_19650 [Noviherbaspirillum denitrificans]